MKKILNKIWKYIKPYFTLKMFPVFMLAWFITNGQAYMFLGLGIALDIEWMRWYGGAYLSILWLPFTPEKLITVPIALFLYRIIYKNKFPIQEEGEQNDTRRTKEIRTKSDEIRL